jgi:hypothetical protein
MKIYKSIQAYTSSTHLINEPKFVFKLSSFDKQTEFELSLYESSCKQFASFIALPQVSKI